MVELAPSFSRSMFGDFKSENARGDLRDSLQARAQVARPNEVDLGGLLGGSTVQQIGENYGTGAALMDGESSSSRDSWYRRSVSEKHVQRSTERMDRGLFADFSGREKSAIGGASERAHSERLQIVGAVDKADVRVPGVQEMNAWPGTADYGRGSGYSSLSSANRSRDLRRTVNKFDVQNIQSSGEVVICTDVQGNITLWNQAAEDMFLYKSDEVTGRDLVYLLSPTHLKTDVQPVMSQVIRGESLAAPAYSVRKDGAILNTFVTSKPIVDHLDEIIGVIVIYEDLNSPSTSKGMIKRSQSSEGFVNDLIEEAVPPTGSGDGKNLLKWKRVQLESDSRSGQDSSDGQSSATEGTNSLMMGRTSVKQLLRKLQIGAGKPNKLSADSSERQELLGDDLSQSNEDYTVAPKSAVDHSHSLPPLYVSAVEREGGGSWGNIGFSEMKSGAQAGTLNQPSPRSSSGRSLGSVGGLDLALLDSPPHNGRSGQGIGMNFLRAEEDFQLQLALALRVSAEAAAIEDPVRGPGGNPRWSSGITQMEATAYRYWVSSCLSYDDRIEDGFYEIWGMSPQMWGMCTDSSDFGRMPPLENLRTVSIEDPSFEVVLIDRSTDRDLIELEDKAVGLAYESSDVLDMASELCIMVARTMGGSAPSDDALAEAWRLSSTKLMQEVDSIVLPIGRLRVGLSRHRALLFKVMADSVGLACRLVRGSAFSNKENDASVIVKCSDDREWMVDLLVRPGSRMPPDKRFPVRPPVIASPLQFDRPNPFAGSNMEHWTRDGIPPNKDLGGGDGTSGSAREAGEAGEFALGFYRGQDASAGGTDQEAIEEAMKKQSDLVHLYEKDGAKASSRASSTSSSPVKQAKAGAKPSFFLQELSRSGERILKDESRIGPEVVQKVGSEVQQTMEAEIQQRVRMELQRRDEPEIQQKVEAEVQQKVGTEMQQKVYRENQRAGSDKNSRRAASPKVDSAKEFEIAWAREGKDGRQPAGSNESAKSGGPGRIVEQLVHDISDFEIVWEDVDLGERIGQGSYGKVFRGDWQGSDVAVKVFLDQDLKNEALEEFKSEVALMRRLRHPNVVLFMGAVTKPPNLSIITEFCPRGSLYRLLHRPNRELDDRKRIRMALDVAKGMNYLHRCSPPVVHRDLKSPNLLVDKNWTVKVCDFGLSRQKHSTFLSSKSSAGTPEWMAPEVLRNEPSDEKSDVYSFGVILWELATLQVPWNGMNPIQVVGAVGFQHRRLVIPDNIDPAIAAVIQACWRTDTKKRPSFAELMQELKSLQQRPLQIQSPQAATRARNVADDE